MKIFQFETIFQNCRFGRFFKDILSENGIDEAPRDNKPPRRSSRTANNENPRNTRKDNFKKGEQIFSIRNFLNFHYFLPKIRMFFLQKLTYYLFSFGGFYYRIFSKY